MQAKQENSRRVVVVRWKKLAENTLEVFTSLKNFCDSHPAYSYNTLNNYLSKKKIAFENEEIRIERKPIQQTSLKPDLPKRLFWEFDYDRLDWQRSFRTVMERVIEWGEPKEWDIMTIFYSKARVIQALREDIPYLTDQAVKNVCAYFQLSQTELRCYTKKQSQQEHWI
jgi:hypothetical protein